VAVQVYCGVIGMQRADQCQWVVRCGEVHPSLGPDAPGDALYRFDAPELKAVNHRLDGAFWPHTNERGTPEQPVVLLEVQMHSKPGFKHRLFAQSARFLQLHPQVLHLAVVVVVPHRRLNLGPARLPQQLQAFVDGVVWLSLEELGQQADLDPLLALLTLPVRPEAQLKVSTPQILERRPDLLSTVLTMLFERFPTLTPEEIMVIAGIPTDQLLHTRAAQDLLDRGRQEGEARGREEGEARGRQEGEARGRAAEAASVTLRQLNRLCGPLSEATTARIRALPLEQLELLAEALLDFSGPADLAAWLKEHAG
jgi:predicted transposase YdaD